MGSPDDEFGRDNDEVQHEVTLSSFYIAKYEVTQAQYNSVMNSTPSFFEGDDKPVEQVSWKDAVKFCIALSIKEGRSPAYTISGDKISVGTGKRMGTAFPRRRNGSMRPVGGRNPTDMYTVAVILWEMWPGTRTTVEPPPMMWEERKQMNWVYMT